MATSDFFTSTLLPILIALALYVLLFHVLLPLYRKHHARYGQYLPLAAATTSAASALTARLLPRFMHPSNLRSRAIDSLGRFFMPLTFASRHATSRRRGRRGSGAGGGDDDDDDDDGERHPSGFSFSDDDDDDDDEDNLLTDESGEALVNFDYSNTTGTLQDQNRRRRDAMERQVARGLQAAREMGMGSHGPGGGGGGEDYLQHYPHHFVATRTAILPEHRLSRDLEAGFRDDSDDDDDQDRGRQGGRDGDEDGDNAVTLGRGRPPVLTTR